MFKKTKYLLLILIAYIFPLLICIKPIISGNIPFWYDPARDMLLAWDNLHKPTLIGPTTGIQGVFYGPFWVWLLSIGIFISRDPRAVDFIIQTIPYFTIFPYILWKLSKNVFNKQISLSLWILFILTFTYYANQLWSPNLAPLLFLITFYYLINTDLLSNKDNLKNLFIIGASLSLMLSFLFSLAMSLPVSLAIYFLIFFIIDFLSNKKGNLFILRNWIIRIGTFITGIFIILLPTLLFEIKHGFNQIKALFGNISNGYVGQVTNQVSGMNRGEMLNEFTNRMASLVHMPNMLFIIIIFVLISYLIYLLIKHKIIITKEEVRMILFILATTASIFIIFITSKNPVWSYRFIGVEIMGLFLVGFLAKKIKFVESMLMVITVIVLMQNLFLFANSFKNNGKINSDFASRLDIVEKIYIDSNNMPFAYFAKNAAIYTFDYDYIFKWLQNKYVDSTVKNISNVKWVYLIIPEELRSDKIGFTENRTPEVSYKTVKEWQGIDKTLIIKREKK